LPIPKVPRTAERLLAGKPEIPTLDVEACLGDPRSGWTVVATGYDFEYRTCSNKFEIRRANDCQLLYVHPQPSAQSLGIIYPSNYVPFRFSQLRGPARWARDFLQSGKARAIVKLAGMDGRILDIGAGSGVLIRQIARIKGSRENLWANDFSDKALASLRREGFQTIVGRVEDLNLDERFQAIVLNQVIEHLQNPKAAVERLSELLTPGGHLFLETPSTDGLDARLFRKRYWGGYHIPRHFWLFNEASLRQLLEGAGLHVVEFRYLTSPVFWIQSFHHLLLDHRWIRLAGLISETNPLLLAPFTGLDLLQIALRGKTTNIRAVAQRLN
jgi:2-polyprenyl-3-methyl-5-hydroxy-6-metoxy-1,4-benzoquinol methylase